MVDDHSLDSFPLDAQCFLLILEILHLSPEDESFLHSFFSVQFDDPCNGSIAGVRAVAAVIGVVGSVGDIESTKSPVTKGGVVLESLRK